MARKFFGTDGIRGSANSYPMTSEVALKVGMAAGKVFTNGSYRHRVVIGKDTRLSGYLIEPALQAGFIAMGMDVFLVGPMPTPAVAMLTRAMRCDLGVVISASHNPFEDNGIKLFGPDGYKLSDEIELEIERRMENGVPERAPSPKLGRAQRLDDAPGRYIEFVKRAFPKDLRLDGLKIAIDCANGAAYKVAPTVLFELGAEIVPLGVTPSASRVARGIVWGRFPSDSTPIASASRRAGSIVSTNAWRPRRAASNASAAATVVLPEPPQPTQTITSRSASIASSLASGFIRERPDPRAARPPAPRSAPGSRHRRGASGVRRSAVPSCVGCRPRSGG